METQGRPPKAKAPGIGTKTPVLVVSEWMLKECHCYFTQDEVLKYEDGWPVSAQSSEKEYEHLSQYISIYVRSYLYHSCGLQSHWLPGGNPANSGVELFTSQDWETNRTTALVLIPGSGKVTLGQWSRGLCKDVGLKYGSLKSYIDSALSLGWSVLVMNPNATNPVVHENRSNTLYTWTTFLPKSPAQRVFIVAHSYGGTCTCYIANEAYDMFQPRVQKIAFTDSVHSRDYANGNGLKPEVREMIQCRAVNWVRSDQPVNILLHAPDPSSSNLCECRSAGHPVHEYTSATALHSVFTYFST